MPFFKMIFENTNCHGTEVGVIRDAIMAVVENELGVSLEPVVGRAFKASDERWAESAWVIWHDWPPPWCFDSLIYWLVTDEQFICGLVACFACFGFGFHRQFWTTPAAPSFLWSANWAVGSGARRLWSRGADQSSKKGSKGPAFFGLLWNSEAISVQFILYIFIYYIQLITNGI